MATESGFTTQKKIGDAQYKTIHALGSDRYGTSVTTKALSEITPAIAVTDTYLSDDQKIVYLEILAHGARKHDVLRASTGALVGWEFEIIEIVDVDTLGVINAADTTLQIGDEVSVLRWVTPLVSASGATIFDTPPAAEPSSLVLDFSTSNVGDAAYVEVLSATTHKYKEIQIFMSSGTPLHLAFGDLGDEENKIVILPGGNGHIPLVIPEATRLSVKALAGQALVDSGLLIINFLG